MNKRLINHTGRLIATAVSTVTLAIAFGRPDRAAAQGSLTPPGAPTSSMITLAQIEPRTIVNAANTPGDSTDLYIISQPGSYYLTGNVIGVSGKSGIEITANNVTLDLDGFALEGVPGTAHGIYIPNGQTNVTVRHGSLSGWGSQGVDSASGNSLNVVFERLNVSTCGGGIYASGPGIVRDCNCQRNFSDGIVCNEGTVTGCTAEYNSFIGIDVYACVVTGCMAQNNGIASSDPGITADASIVTDCISQANSFYGIEANSSIVRGCQVSANVRSGIYVNAPGCEIIGNSCTGNNTAGSATDAGIYINDSHNRIEDNQVTLSLNAGILVNSSYTNNIIIKNTVSGSGTGNYLVPGAQIVGPIISTTGTITSANPWANFSF